MSGEVAALRRGQVVLAHGLGLHLRAAGKISSCAQKFSAEITLCFEGRRADALSLMDILSLGATDGTTLELDCSGPDAEAAFAAMRDLLAGGLDERGG